MTRARDVANVLSTATALATDTETAAAISTHSSASDPHAGYVLESLIDAKGDLIVGSADNTVAKLSIGNSGDSIVADSAATTGLSYQTNSAAGKNKIINGAFDFWQRGTSLTGGTIADGTFLADRWRNVWVGSNPTNISLTRETFTPAELNAIGYGDAKYYQKMAIVTIGASTGYRIEQFIEDVTTFAGQNVTVSFWCKADEAHTLTVSFSQNFGSGGSASTSNIVTMSNATTPTSWTRVTGTVALPSISGKTIGNGNYLLLRIEIGIASCRERVFESV
jgi:hypothetical protein